MSRGRQNHVKKSFGFWRKKSPSMFSCRCRGRSGDMSTELRRNTSILIRFWRNKWSDHFCCYFHDLKDDPTAPKSTFGLQIQIKIDTMTSWIALGGCIWSVRDAQNDTLTLRNHPGRNPDESKNHSIDFGLDLAFKSRFWTLPDRLWGHENSIRSDPIIFSFKI